MDAITFVLMLAGSLSTVAAPFLPLVALGASLAVWRAANVVSKAYRQ
jgi:hypothetical protein